MRKETDDSETSEHDIIGVILETTEQKSTNIATSGTKKLSSFKKRTITAAVYILVWIGLCALKWCAPWGKVAGGWGALGFDAVFAAVSVIGSLEFLRAIDNSNSGVKISTPQRSFTVAFCAAVVPLYVLIDMIPVTNGSGFLAIACAFVVYSMFLAATSVFDHDRSTVKGTIYCLFCMLYCGVLSAMLSSINHLTVNSMAAIILLFLCSIFTDTGAYIIGSLLKRFIPLKLAPKLSPNKTVIGAVGGLLGGIVAGIISYYIITGLGGLINGVDLITRSTNFNPLLSFVLVGFCTSVLCQIGDLFESAIKRECGIKDMGNILPGHGGILDRFDSMLYCSVVVLLSFGTII